MQVYGRFPYNSQFLCKKEKKQRELLPDDTQEIEHVDAVLKLLSIITGDDSYRNIKLPEGRRKKDRE